MARMREAKIARKVAQLVEVREFEHSQPLNVSTCPVCGAWVGSNRERHLARLRCLSVDERQELRGVLFDRLGSWKKVSRWFEDRLIDALKA